MKRIIPAVLILLCALSLTACRHQNDNIGNSVNWSPDAMPEIAVGEELLCLADSLDEAENTAEIYGIELVRFGNGIAVFHTDENPGDVIQRGIENGWPQLSLNNIQYAFGNG